MSQPLKRVLVIHSRPPVLQAIGRELATRGIAAEPAATIDDVRRKVASGTYSAVLLEAKLQPDKAIKLLAFIRKSVSKQALLFVSGAYLEPAVLDKLESAGAVRRLAAAFQEAEAVVREVCGVLLPKKKAFYDVNVINCVVQSVIDVLEYYSGELPALDPMKLKDGRATAPGYATGVSSLIGPHARGSLSMACDKDFITRMASRVSGITRGDGRMSDAQIGATTSDLCDQIFGKAGVLLATLGWQFEVSLPDVHVQDGHAVQHLGDAPVMTIPFRLGKTKFTVEFCLEES
jgi:CheY-specific phosphatase CheX